MEEEDGKQREIALFTSIRILIGAKPPAPIFSQPVSQPVSHLDERAQVLHGQSVGHMATLDEQKKKKWKFINLHCQTGNLFGELERSISAAPPNGH